MATLTRGRMIALSIVCLCLPLTLTTASAVTAADPMSYCVLGGPCPNGKVCAGNSQKKRCVTPMPVLAVCKGDPFWVCEEGLECRHGICRPPIVPFGGRCEKPGSECEPGTVCAGTARVKKCVKPMREGGACKRDPYWVCEEGLECRHEICRPPIVPLGGRCEKPGSECEPGTVCAGTWRVKKCVKPMREGGACKRDPYWVCEEGLECRHRICRPPIVPLGGRCEKPGSECTPGTVCAGTWRVKKCVKPMREGGACKRDPYWVCEEGLECLHRVCRKPVVPTGGRCDKPGVVCVPGTVCAGTARVKKCVKPMPVGGACKRDPFWVCAKGLKCVDQICKRMRMPRGIRCDRPGVECPKGTVCVGNHVKRCITPMKAGGVCRKDPFWICEEGLLCKDNVCTFMVEDGGKCMEKGAMCVEGTRCVGTTLLKKCKKPMPLGGYCGQDPFWYCDDGLKCSGGDSAGKCVEA